MDDPRTIAGRGLLAGGGETGELLRSLDWSATPLGPVETWPQSLRTASRILLTSRFAMWMGWGPDLAFLYNDAYRRDTLGKKHPWAFGRPAREVWAEIWSDIAPRIQTVLETGEATWDEALLLFLERSGYPEETYHTFSYSPLTDDDGGMAGMFCVVMEETERVIGERRLATLRDLAADLASTSREEEVLAAIARGLAVNPRDLPFTLLYLFEDEGKRARLAARTGIEAGHPAAPLVAETGAPDEVWPAAEVWERPAPMTVEAARLGALPTGAWDVPPREAVVVPVSQQGQERPAGFLVAGLNPYRPFDADYAGFVGLVAGQIASSLANARAYEEERKRAEALAELDRAKTTFFGNVSHEFRTPLTLMLGPMEDLLGDGGGPLPPHARRELELIHRNSLRLLRLVNTLLDFSRIEAGRAQAHFEPTELSAYTAELASTFRSAVERAGLALVVDAPPLPEPVYVDREMWEKIVLNFLSNSFKFTLQGEIAVSVRPVGGAVELAVRDTGSGIPAEELPHVFERFHRVKGARGRTHEGTGIGLALVQELVRLHGGEATVESEPGRGSTFRVRIPTGTAHLPPDRVGPARAPGAAGAGATPYVAEALRWLSLDEREDGDRPPPPAREEGSAGAARRGARILLADDNADMRDYVARLLVEQRYRVEAVPNGAAALEAVRRERPDLVLSDVMMPEMDGFELLEALRADPGTREIPIVLLSARAGEEARIEGVEAGADDYLVKPFSARELLARVGAHLEMARMRSEAAEMERTLRREAELARAAAETAGARLREIFMRAPAIIATLRGPEYVFESANPRYLEHIGRDDILGRPLAEVAPEVVEQGFIDLLDRVYRTGEPFIADERSILLDRRGDGPPDEVFANFVYQPLFEADGSVSGIFVHAVDVTDQVLARKQVEIQATELEELQAETEAINEELQQTNEELFQRTREAEEANVAKASFLATMSHELRTPLNAMIGYTDLLQMGVPEPIPDGAREQVRRVGLSARHLLQLIEEILTFSRLEAGRETVQAETVDLRELVQEVSAILEPLAQERGLRFDVPRTTSPAELRTDPRKLRQILINLVGNAVKFTERGGVELSVADEAGWVCLRVRDTGIGISPDHLETVFEPFRQVETDRARRAHGSGLGLSVARRLTLLLDGELRVESTPGQGSTFTLRLPAQGPAEADSGDPEARPVDG